MCAALTIASDSCPWLVGSGNVGTWWARMQLANASTPLTRAAICCADGPAFAFWGLGRIPAHALRADWKLGEETNPGVTCIDRPCWPGWSTTCGSGKLVTPLWRMQLEYL